MTDLAPEQQFASLAPVYADLPYDVADVLDAVVFAYPQPATYDDVVMHVWGSTETRRYRKTARRRLRIAERLLNEHGMRLAFTHRPNSGRGKTEIRVVGLRRDLDGAC